MPATYRPTSRETDQASANQKAEAVTSNNRKPDQIQVRHEHRRTAQDIAERRRERDQKQRHKRQRGRNRNERIRRYCYGSLRRHAIDQDGLTSVDASGITLEWLVHRAQLELHGGICQACDGSLTLDGEKTRITLDRRDPDRCVSRSNVWFICAGCNSRKLRMPPDAFDKLLYQERLDAIIASTFAQLDLFGPDPRTDE